MPLVYLTSCCAAHGSPARHCTKGACAPWLAYRPSVLPGARPKSRASVVCGLFQTPPNYQQTSSNTGVPRNHIGGQGRRAGKLARVWRWQAAAAAQGVAQKRQLANGLRTTF